MPTTRLHELHAFGQSVWLDNINRSLIDSGKLQTLIDQGVRGVTSNPSIFNNAVSKNNDYDAHIKELKKNGKTTFEIYDELTVRDIQDAADMFLPIWSASQGLDGYISLEINPKLAYDSEQSIEEGKRLFERVNRPNCMLKVPATVQGFPVITSLISHGINVNTTLIFSLQQYMETAQAYMDGMEQLLDKGSDISKVCGVASVFVSRVDTLVDTYLEELIDGEHDEDAINTLESLRGKAANANAGIIYANFCELLASERFKKVQAKGAKPQRIVWGSTSTKNPDYSDIKYVSGLIGKNTVNTIPEKTLTAFLDHGNVKETLTCDATKVQQLIKELHIAGIDMSEVCTTLLADGVTAFSKAFDALLVSIEKKAKGL